MHRSLFLPGIAARVLSRFLPTTAELSRFRKIVLVLVVLASVDRDENY
jgi:hypothetical protein